MANGFALIVEDAATSSDLMRPALSQWGLDVRTASTTEEALKVFEEIRPQLVLADIALPGVDAFELTKQLKSDPAKAGAIVLALGDFSGNDNEQKALAAGCNGCVAKPVDTGTLPALLEKYFGQKPAPSDVPVSSASAAPLSTGSMEPDADPEIRELQEEFVAEAMVQAKQLLTTLDAGLDQRVARVTAHRWAGSGGSVGYAEVTRSARELEALLSENGAGSPARIRELLTDLEGMFTEAREKLSRMPAAEGAAAGHPGEAQGVSSTALASALAGKRFVLAGFDLEEATRLTQALDRFQVLSRNLGAGARLDAETVRPFDAVLLHVAQGVHAIPRWNKPLVMIGPREVLLGLQALQNGAAEFVSAPWTEEELVLRSYFALVRAAQPGGARGASAKGGERRVLVADDDPTIRALVKTALLHAGFECRVAVDGNEALAIIRSWQPDLAVIDVQMPGKDGFQVLTALRGDPLTLDIPVVLLTACQQDKDVILGFQLGANDYVVKPFMPIELIERVRKLLRKHTRKIWITRSGSGGVLYA